MRQAYQLSENRACGLIGITRWINRYQSRRDRQEELRMRLGDLAGSRVRYGYRRLTVLLRREGDALEIELTGRTNDYLSTDHKVTLSPVAKDEFELAAPPSV